jgi:hypothetical protein
MLKFVRQFRDARRVSVPLIAVHTPDPAATIRALIGALNGDAETAPLMQWDVLTGLTGINKPGKEVAKTANGGGKPAMTTNKPSAACAAIALVAETPQPTKDDADAMVASNSVTFFHQMHGFWSDVVARQGIWNMRDKLKSIGGMGVMLVSLGASLPAELSNDVLEIEEDLPSADDIREITRQVFATVPLSEPTEDELTRAVDASLGIPAFPIEQNLFMCTTKAKRLDVAELWERKRQIIEAGGLMQVFRSGERFADIGGCFNVKGFNQKLIDARAFRLVLFMDELEKMFAGTGTDSSGVTTKLTGEFLSWMQDTGALGELFIGHPGAAKSAIAKSIGNESGVPTIAFNVSRMETSLVGESGNNMRGSLKTVQAMSQGRVLVIGTCNKIGALSPELRRRFKLSTFFFDLPTDEARAKIWDIYRQKCKTTGELPDDNGWTGAEIRTCCEQSELLQCSLEEAASYIVPVSKSAPDDIKALRDLATGKFINAEEGGVYEYVEQATAARPMRKFRPDADGMTRKGNA